MINFDSFSAYLNNKPAFKVDTNDTVDEALIVFFSQHTEWPVQKILTLFTYIEPAAHFQCTALCKCGAPFGTITKSKIAELIQTRRGKVFKRWHSALICNACLRAEKQQQSESQKIQNEARAERQEKATETFINDYLNPENSWAIPAHQWHRQLLSALCSVESDVVHTHICGMLYQDFLKTPYWKAVAQQVRYRAKFRCQLCSEGGENHVHHRNYACHGDEANQLGELICLCAGCHQNFHNQN